MFLTGHIVVYFGENRSMAFSHVVFQIFVEGKVEHEFLLFHDENLFPRLLKLESPDKFREIIFFKFLVIYRYFVFIVNSVRINEIFSFFRNKINFFFICRMYI